MAKITLTETPVTPDEAKLLACFLAASRAAIQADAIKKRLALRVLKLAQKYPSLLFDGARIKTASRKVWSYTSADILQKELELDCARRLAQLLVKDKSELAEATVKTVEFPKVHELSKLTNQVPEKEACEGFISRFITSWPKPSRK